MNAQRLSIFIDGGYVFKVFQTHYARRSLRYSPKRLIRLISENVRLVRVHYFDAINTRNPETRAKQERFYYGILRDTLHWDVQVSPLQWPDGQHAEQKGVDTALALSLQGGAVDNEYDVAILIAADSDFVPAVDGAKSRGKIVRNAYFAKRPSWHLQQACNGVPIRLDDVPFVFRKENPLELFSLSSLSE